MALKNFPDSVAVITGGASGIGLATARALYAAGANIVLADLNEPGLQQAITKVREARPDSTAQVLAVTTDVRSEQQVQELMRKALDACGRIDLVVTSAGIGKGGPVDTYSGEAMQRMIDINFMGTYHCVHNALPAMRKQGSGHFVFLSSVAGKLSVPLLSAYCASKWAVRGFGSALRAEFYGTGIGVTTVYPAWVDTPMVHQEENGLDTQIEILLTPEMVAEAILQAVQEDRADLTLAPNQDIAMGLQLMQADPDLAEQVMGKSFWHRQQTT